MPHPYDFLEELEHFIERHGLFGADEPVTVGVSGGVDSMVLLLSLHELAYDVVAAHVNHGLREAAAADEEFIRERCRKLSIPFSARKIDPAAYATTTGTSVQDASRTLRYRALAEMAIDAGSSRIAVAHHADDQAETVLLQLFRGAGPEGLAAMNPKRVLDEVAGAEGVSYVIKSAGDTDRERGRTEDSEGPSGNNESLWLARPFLAFRRRQINAFAEARSIDWRDDESNTETKYARNALRHEVMPVIEQWFGKETTPNITRSASLLGQYLDVSWRSELEHRFEVCRSTASAKNLDLTFLRAQPEVWQGRIIMEAVRRWLPDVRAGRAAVDQIERLYDAERGRRIEFGDMAVWRSLRSLHFLSLNKYHGSYQTDFHLAKKREKAARAAAAAPPAAPVLERSNWTWWGVLHPGGELELEQGKYESEFVSVSPVDMRRAGPNVAFLEAGYLKGPLYARPWRAGDRLRPLGMDGEKLVSDLLTDEKTPTHLRDEVMVLCDWEKIVWVVGVRLNHDVRTLRATEKPLRVSFTARSGSA